MAFPGSAPAPAAPVAAEPAKAAADDDDFDLFGDDDEDEEETEEEKKIKEERVAAYNEKKATKKAIIAKSSILLDCKPWDDETDMKKMEELVRTIQMDGLVWVRANWYQSVTELRSCKLVQLSKMIK